MNGYRDLFQLNPRVSYLNHASFGAPTRAALSRATSERRRIERDTATSLGAVLYERLAEQAAAVATQIGVEPDGLVLTQNSTEANAAVASSWPLRPGDHVMMTDLEYASVVRSWQVAAARCGAVVDIVHLDVPVSVDAVLECVRGAHPATRVTVLSVVTSSTAVRMPVQVIAAACLERGIALILDAAHVVGHADLDLVPNGATAAFGSLHKWLPVPRPVGFLWLSEAWREVVRPAVVSLYWDSSLAQRFGWRGTWDPVPALGVGAALDEHRQWRTEGLLDAAEAVAEECAQGLTAIGARPTAAHRHVPPRLRAFIVDVATPQLLQSRLDADGVRAWCGQTADGRTLLRISTHFYNDAADVDRLCDSVAAAVRASAAVDW